MQNSRNSKIRSLFF